MKNNWTRIGTGRIALAAVLAATIGGAFAQGNNQPSGQAPSGGTTNVVVTNTTAQPVPVKEQNNPAFQPFQITVQPYVSAGQAYNYAFVPVPAGKRLVIEQVSGAAFASGVLSGTVARMTVIGSVGSSPNIFVPMSFVGNNPASQPIFAASQPIRMYVDGGTSFSVLIHRSADINGGYSGSLSSTISVVGYLVDIP